jgi:hypothetical protein
MRSELAGRLSWSAFSDAPCYTWSAKSGGVTAPDARRLRDLEAENNQLKKLLAELLLDAEALKVAGAESLNSTGRAGSSDGDA